MNISFDNFQKIVKIKPNYKTTGYDRSMKQWAVAFDLDTKQMTKNGLTKSQKTQIYQKEIPNAFIECGFDCHPQGSVYHTSIEAHDKDSATLSLMKLKPTLIEKAPNLCKYVKCIHVFEMADWADVTEFITGKASQASTPEEELEQAEELAELACL